MNAIARMKSSITSRLEALAELAGLAFSASGATLAAVLGKLVIAGVLCAVALGFLLRLKSRSRNATAPTQATVAKWVRPAAAIASAIEVAVLVEATNLPVRFNQEGFQYGHWYLLGLAFFAAYFLQAGALASVVAKREPTVPVERR